MAPYIGLMQELTPEERQLVVMFLTGQEEPVVEAKSNADIIREKFKRLKISPETKELVSGLSLSAEEMDDERTKYILGYK
jgi:hypothetical protein